MAYETGSASDPNDLLDKLRIFALANGWAVDYYGNRTNVGGASQGNGLNALAINKGGYYWVIYHETSSNSTANPTPRLSLYTYPGPWVAANGSDAQANRTTVCSVNKIGGPYVGYHFFTDAGKTYLHAAVEVVVGRFCHFHLGLLDKVGFSSEIPYVTGLRWDYSTSPSRTDDPEDTNHWVPWDATALSSAEPNGGAMRVDSDGISPRNVRINRVQGNTTGTYADGGFRSGGSGDGYSRLLMQIGPSTLTGRSILVPLIVAVGRNSVDTQKSIVGAPHDLRAIRIDSLAPGDVVTIGADQWKVFPIIRKGIQAGIESSGGYGYAYRIVS